MHILTTTWEDSGIDGVERPLALQNLSLWKFNLSLEYLSHRLAIKCLSDDNSGIQKQVLNET